MAIAAALNILVSAPTQQLKTDLRANGLTVSQFSRHVKTMFGRASQQAKDDIKKMAAAVNVALKECVISEQEHTKALNVLGNAYTYVHNGGESYSKMLQDAAAITARASDGTSDLLARLKQLDAMYKAGKISAAAYSKEVASMQVSHSAAATANFGPAVAKIAGRTQAGMEKERGQGRRTLDRAWMMGAIQDAKDYNAELRRLNKPLEDAAGITKINDEAERRRQRDTAIGSEINERHATTFETMASRMEELNRVRGELNPGVFERERDAITGTEDARQKAIQKRLDLERQASTLNANHLSDNEKQARQLEELNELRRNGLQDAAYFARFDDITGITANRAEKQSQRDAARSKELQYQNRLVTEANELNTRYASLQEQLGQNQLRLNALRATGAITEEVYQAALKDTTNQIRMQNSAMRNLGFTMHNLRAAMGLFNPWLVATIAVGALVKDSMEFESAMSRVHALSGASAEEMERMTAAAMEMGRVTIQTAKDAATALSAFAQAGFSTDEAIAALRPTLRLATIGEMEVADAAEVAARIMAGMKIPASEFADVVDAIAVAANASLTSVEDLGNALKFVGPIANQAGVSLEETLAALMTLSAAGLQGELGGTSLRNQLLKMSKQSKEAKAAMEELGVTFRDMDGDLLPLVDIIQQFEEALEGLGTAERLEMINKIFEARAAVGFTALVNSGSDNFQAQVDLLKEREGIAAAMEEQITNNLMGDLELLSSALLGLANDIFNSGLGPIFRFMAEGLTLLVQTLQMIYNTAQALVSGLANILSQLVVSILDALPDFIVDKDSGIMKWAKEQQNSTFKNQNEALDNALKARSAAGGSLSKMFGGGDDELEKKMAAMQKRRAEIEASLADRQKMTPELQEQLMLEQQNIEATSTLLSDMEKITGELKDQAGVLRHGEDQWLRMKLAADIALETDESRKDMLQKQLDLLIQQQEVMKYIALGVTFRDVKESLRTNRMTEGDKAWEKAFGAGSSETMNTPADIAARRALDSLMTEKSLDDALLEVEKERAKLRADMVWNMDRERDAMDEVYRLQLERAQADGLVTDGERARLAALQAQQNAIRDINTELERREQLEKDAKKLKEDALALDKKANPLKEWEKEFQRIEVMRQAKLLDDAAANKAQQDLLNKTLKGAGPKNIGLAGAVIEDSAEGYSAKLPEFKNPEFEELKAQTKLAAKSLDMQGKINKGVADFNKTKESKKQIPL